MSKRWPKIWGWNDELIKNDISSLNILCVTKGGQCSYHKHEHNYNLFYLVSGKLEIKTDKGTVTLEPGQNFLIHPGTEHQFTGLEDSMVVEYVYVELNPLDIIRSSQGTIVKADEHN